MNELSWKIFGWSIVFGIGLHIGWGLISLLLWVLFKVLGHDDMPFWTFPK